LIPLIILKLSNVVLRWLVYSSSLVHYPYLLEFVLLPKIVSRNVVGTVSLIGLLNLSTHAPLNLDKAFLDNISVRR